MRLSGDPIVSIIVPMLNHAPYVRRTLKSILAENSVPIEVIVSDDGSTDGSSEVVRSIPDSRIKLIEGPRQGISANFNAGLAAASGDIIMRCDSDDLYANGRIARQVRFLARHSEYGAVCGSFAAFRGWITAPLVCAGTTPRDITHDLNSGRVDTAFNTYAVRRDLIAGLGGASTKFLISEDIDLQLRLSEVCAVAYEPHIAYYWRLLDNSVTHTATSREKELSEQRARDEQSKRLRRGPALLVQEQTTLRSGEHLQQLLIGCAWASTSRIERIYRSALAVLAKPSSGWRNLAAALVRP